VYSGKKSVKSVPSPKSTASHGDSKAKRHSPSARKDGTHSVKSRPASKGSSFLTYSHDPDRVAEFEALAAELLRKTTFCGEDWRSVRPLSSKGLMNQEGNSYCELSACNRDEFDFVCLPESLHQFARIWEYSREIKECYDPTLKKGNLPRRNPRLPSDSQAQLLWSWNESFFPVPISTLWRERAFRIPQGSSNDSVFSKTQAVRELDPTIFSSLAYRSDNKFAHVPGSEEARTIELPLLLKEDHLLTFLGQFSPDLWKEVLGCGTAGFWDAARMPRTGEEAHMSFHAIAIDWERGKDAIKSELETWVEMRREDFRKRSDSRFLKNRTSQGRKPDGLAKIDLSQLAVWRAHRVGYTFQTYLKARASWAGILDAREKFDIKRIARKFKTKVGWPTYPRQGEFKSTAKQFIEKLKPSTRDSSDKKEGVLGVLPSRS
jgi:hypothetical protein